MMNVIGSVRVTFMSKGIITPGACHMTSTICWWLIVVAKLLPHTSFITNYCVWHHGWLPLPLCKVWRLFLFATRAKNFEAFLQKTWNMRPVLYLYHTPIIICTDEKLLWGQVMLAATSCSKYAKVWISHLENDETCKMCVCASVVLYPQQCCARDAKPELRELIHAYIFTQAACSVFSARLLRTRKLLQSLLAGVNTK